MIARLKSDLSSRDWLKRASVSNYAGYESAGDGGLVSCFFDAEFAVASAQRSSAPRDTPALQVRRLAHSTLSA